LVVVVEWRAVARTSRTPATDHDSILLVGHRFDERAGIVAERLS
jgi:hypothetical protein